MKEKDADLLRHLIAMFVTLNRPDIIILDELSVARIFVKDMRNIAENHRVRVDPAWYVRIHFKKEPISTQEVMENCVPI